MEFFSNEIHKKFPSIINWLDENRIKKKIKKNGNKNRAPTSRKIQNKA